MAQEIKELLTVLADLVGKTPDTALMILLGIGIFKLVIFLSTTGSVVLIGRLIVERLYAYGIKPKEVVNLVRINDVPIWEGSKSEFVTFVEKMVFALNTRRREKYKYFQEHDAKFVIDAVKEKIERDSSKGTV